MYVSRCFHVVCTCGNGDVCAFFARIRVHPSELYPIQFDSMESRFDGSFMVCRVVCIVCVVCVAERGGV